MKQSLIPTAQIFQNPEAKPGWAEDSAVIRLLGTIVLFGIGILVVHAI
ncbi:MAG TPA: hypothetical protein VMF67_12855 [Rhizomicrobium sp.]|nr:hypothetical protein [Rhizomicrobium sp.]